MNKSIQDTMRTVNRIPLCALLLAAALLLAGCGEESTQGQDRAAEPTSPIIESLQEMTPEATPENQSRELQIERAPEVTPSPAPADTGMISGAEAPKLEIKDPKTPETETKEDEKKEDEPKEENTTGNGTPLIFDVSDCTVVAYGDFDPTMEDAIFAAINAYRTRGNLELMERNMSLDFCADVRAKELTYCLNHTRPNQTFWYTVAPAYDHAELIAADYSEAQRTVDAWMSTSSGRQYLLGNNYRSIGISVFRSDGRNFIAASIGD